MKNFIADGNSLQIAAPSGGVTGGAGYLVGKIFTVAVATAAENEQVTMMTKGAYRGLAKATGEAWVVGDMLYYSTTNSNLTKTSSGNTFAGYAYSAAQSADAIGDILLSH